MNEDAWENLDTWERRDHELIRGYLSDAPVWFGERELKAWMNNSFWNDGLRRIKLKRLMNCSGWVWEEFSQSKTIMRGCHKLELWIFKRTVQDLGEILLRSSNVENDDENYHELLRYSGMKIRKVEPTMKRIWKILEKDIWLMMTHSYVKLWKEFGNSSGKIRRVR